MLFKKVGRENTPDLKKWRSDTRSGKNREKQLSSHEKPFEKPALGAASAKGLVSGQRKKTLEIAHNGQQKVSALEEKSVE